MTKDEALKLALEALEYHIEQTRPIHRTSEAITAIREALAEQPAQQEPVAFITPLMEQQMFDDWCPYKGNPDPRVVWAAAVNAVNGLLLGATPQAQPAQPAQQEPDRVKFERHWRKTRGEKKANRELPRHPLQPQTYIQDSANRHWVTWQAAVRSVFLPASKPLTDEQQIAEALRRHSLTLIKTTRGYDVLKLGQIDAHGSKENT